MNEQTTDVQLTDAEKRALYEIFGPEVDDDYIKSIHIEYSPSPEEARLRFYMRIINLLMCLDESRKKAERKQ